MSLDSLVELQVIQVYAFEMHAPDRAVRPVGIDGAYKQVCCGLYFRYSGGPPKTDPIGTFRFRLGQTHRPQHMGWSRVCRTTGRTRRDRKPGPESTHDRLAVGVPDPQI